MNNPILNTDLPAQFVTGWRVKVSKDDYCSMHTHTNWELVYHKQVTGQSMLGGGDAYCFAAQSMVLYAPGTEHDQHSQRRGTDHCVHLHLPNSLANQLPACLVSLPIHDSDLISNCISLCHTRLPQPGLSQWALNHQATFVLLRFLQATQSQQQQQRLSSKENYATHAREYITEQFRHIQSVQDIAAHLKIGYDHLRHVFCEHYGMSLNQCLIQARIARSEQLLEHTVLTQAQIAELVGFANERYFNTSFKKTVGITPGQYRRQSQSGATTR